MRSELQAGQLAHVIRSLLSDSKVFPTLKTNYSTGADPEGKLSEALWLARSASNAGVWGVGAPETFLGATPFRLLENAPFGLKLAELSN